MAAFKSLSLPLLAASILLSLSAVVQQSEAADFTVEVTVVHMHVKGTASLPDPSPLNAFLRQNTSLFNPLFPAPHPPLQLQKCSSTIYQTNAFDFYSLQHPGGCGSAPGFAKDPDQERMVHKYDKIVGMWAGVLLGLAVLLGCVWLVIPNLAARVCSCLGKMLVPPAVPSSPVYNDNWFIGFLVLVCITMVGLMASFFLGIFMYLGVIGIRRMKPAELPDPVSLNHFLSTSNQTATLYLCNIRNLFEVYVGFADSCGQLQDSIYPGQTPYIHTATLPPAAHGSGISFLMILASMVTYASWVVILTGTLYCCCCCGPIFKSVRRELRERKQVRSVELQAPSGSAV